MTVSVMPRPLLPARNVRVDGLRTEPRWRVPTRELCHKHKFTPTIAIVRAVGDWRFPYGIGVISVRPGRSLSQRGLAVVPRHHLGPLSTRDLRFYSEAQIEEALIHLNKCLV